MVTDRKFARTLHACLFFAALGATVVGLAPPSWPWYLLLPMLAYAGVVLAIPLLRRTAPRLKIGRTGGPPLTCAIVLAITTSAVLVAFHLLARPNIAELATKLPPSLFGSVILAGVVFSLVNAAMEELVFRGLLWAIVAEEWNERIALVLTSLMFGVLHLHGYPPGPLGAVLAGLYGFALGFLRRWTGGIGLALACHVFADATVFGLLNSTSVFEL